MHLLICPIYTHIAYWFPRYGILCKEKKKTLSLVQVMYIDVRAGKHYHRLSLNCLYDCVVSCAIPSVATWSRVRAGSATPLSLSVCLSVSFSFCYIVTCYIVWSLYVRVNCPHLPDRFPGNTPVRGSKQAENKINKHLTWCKTYRSLLCKYWISI